MEIGDRVTIMVGSYRLNDGEIVGEDGGAWRVWIPARGVTRTCAQDELALLTSRFTPRPPREFRRRERDSEHVRQQRVAGR